MLEASSWMGEIPSEWKVSKIGNAYTARNEKVSDLDYPPLSVTMKGVVPQLATAAKSDDHNNRKLVKKGDFCINSRSDRRGSCGISPYDGSVSLINTILEPRGEMVPDYYEWLFHTSQFADEFYKWGHGIVDDLWTTGWSEMKRIYIPVPPITEQGAIAKVLNSLCGDIDVAINEAKNSIDDYTSLKQSVIVHAMTGELSDCQIRKDSEIIWARKIPEKWGVTALRHVCSFKTGTTPSTKNPEWFDGELDWFTPGDFNEGYTLSNSKRKLSELAAIDKEAVIFPANTVMVVGIGGTAGKVGITSNRCSANQQITGLFPANNLLPKYLMYWMSIASVILREQSMHTTLPILNNQTLGSVLIAIPSLREQLIISDYLDNRIVEINEIIREKEKLIIDLELYKKAVIYDLVTGKRKVV